jgi:hypothetical protein
VEKWPERAGRLALRPACLTFVGDMSTPGQRDPPGRQASDRQTLRRRASSDECRNTRNVPRIDLPDDELSAVIKALRGVLEGAPYFSIAAAPTLGLALDCRLELPTTGAAWRVISISPGTTIRVSQLCPYSEREIWNLATRKSGRTI